MAKPRDNRQKDLLREFDDISRSNATRHTPLPVEQEMRIAELVVHQLDQPAVRPHRARREMRSAR